jgi:hypothetical protein
MQSKAYIENGHKEFRQVVFGSLQESIFLLTISILKLFYTKKWNAIFAHIKCALGPVCLKCAIYVGQGRSYQNRFLLKSSLDFLLSTVLPC